MGFSSLELRLKEGVAMALSSFICGHDGAMPLCRVELVGLNPGLGKRCHGFGDVMDWRRGPSLALAR